MIYLDNNATTASLPEVREAVLNAIDMGAANPSSPHSAGDPARELIADAHDHVARLIGASAEQVFFTSSGTEANNWAMHMVASTGKARLITTPIEHESVLRKAEMLEASGVNVAMLPVDRNGIVCLEAAADMITPDIGLVSVQWVNNETGVIQPVEEIAALCHAQGVLFHTDAAQAVGKLAVDVNDLQADYLTFTGHKIHAPMGIGVLCRRHGAPLMPLLGGGMQESGLRPGSQNLAGIAGLAAASRIRQERLSDVQDRLTALRDTFERIVLTSCDGAQLNTTRSADRVCNTSSIRFPGVDGEGLLAQLITQGLCCSQGSACTSQIPEPSHTLLAMGLDTQQAYQSIRFSFSELNSLTEVEEAAQIVSACYRRLKDMFAQSPMFTRVQEEA